MFTTPPLNYFFDSQQSIIYTKTNNLFLIFQQVIFIVIIIDGRTHVVLKGTAVQWLQSSQGTHAHVGNENEGFCLLIKNL